MSPGLPPAAPTRPSKTLSPAEGVPSSLSSCPPASPAPSGPSLLAALSLPPGWEGGPLLCERR